MKKYQKGQYQAILTKSYLIQEYVKKGKSSVTIAKKLGCSLQPIYKYLHKYNITIHRPTTGISTKKYKCKECKKVISYQSAIYGSHFCKNCARKGIRSVWFGKSHTKKTLELMRQKAILRYKNPEEHKKMSLAKGGTGIPQPKLRYPLEFNKDLKLKIRKRDNFTCQMSGMTEAEHLKKHGIILSVHHIDYDKNNCKKSNLITLSRIWNEKVNANRKYWTKYFRKLIKDKI